jgi:hypothetical protein
MSLTGERVKMPKDLNIKDLTKLIKAYKKIKKSMMKETDIYTNGKIYQ